MVEGKKQPGFFIQRSFTDVDELSVLAHAWDLDFRQLNPGVFHGSVVQFGDARFQAAWSRLQGIIHQRGSTPDSLRTFAIPAQDGIRLVWRGHRVTANQVLVFPVSGELESTSAFDFDVFVLSLSEESLDAAAFETGLAWGRSALREMEIVTCECASFALLRRWCRSCVSSVTSDRELLARPQILRRLERRAARLLVRALAGGRVVPASRAVGLRMRQTEAAVQIASRAEREVPTVAQLCRIVGASERTLRRGFRERFGVSPKVFLKAQQLVAVRRALRVADPLSTKVADISNRFGFWHQGQFAADYQRQFGELPSQTLRHGAGPPVR